MRKLTENGILKQKGIELVLEWVFRKQNKTQNTQNINEKATIWKMNVKKNKKKNE